MGQFGIGQPVTRFEDRRLLQGEGRFLDDVRLPGQTQAVILRSPHAHARIVSLDTAAAAKAPGVVAVFTGADVARDGLGTMQMTLKRKRPDGAPMFAPPHRGRPPYVRAGRCSYPVRTREPTGVVEVERGARVTRGDLFDLWGRPLRERWVWVGGRRHRGDPRAIPLVPHAQIVLSDDPRVPVHATYVFPPGL